MNKMIKGSIAGAAGVALLAGGYGSYALWSDDANLTESSVTSGVLTIERNNDGVYANPSNTGDTSWASDDLMVPGDVVTYTETFDLAGTGKNLEGAVDFAEEAVDSTFASGDLTRDIDITISGTDFTAGPDNSFTFDDPFDSAVLEVVVTYTFVDAEDTDSQGATATTTATPASTIIISQTN